MHKMVLSSGAFWEEDIHRTCVADIPFECENRVIAKHDFKKALELAIENKEESFKFLGNSFNTDMFRFGWRMLSLEEWFTSNKRRNLTILTD